LFISIAIFHDFIAILLLLFLHMLFIIITIFVLTMLQTQSWRKK